MAYADVKSRLVTHARTAAASLAIPIEDVQVGPAWPKGRCVRVYYGGEVDPLRIGSRDLTGELVAKVTWITAFWPLSALEEELISTVDAEADAFAHALRTAVDGDVDMNGQTDNTTLEHVVLSDEVLGNTRYLVLTWRAVTDYYEYTVSK